MGSTRPGAIGPHPKGRSAAQSGEGRLFCPARNAAGRGKELARAVAGPDRGKAGPRPRSPDQGLRHGRATVKAHPESAGAPASIPDAAARERVRDRSASTKGWSSPSTTAQDRQPANPRRQRSPRALEDSRRWRVTAPHWAAAIQAPCPTLSAVEPRTARNLIRPAGRNRRSSRERKPRRGPLSWERAYPVPGDRRAGWQSRPQHRTRCHPRSA